MPVIATVATRPRARCTARLPPARSICDSTQPPKMSPLALASAGMAMVRSAGSWAGGGGVSTVLMGWIPVPTIYCVSSLNILPYPACGDFRPLLILPPAMADLFDSARKSGSAYSAKDIEVLEGLEPVRRRPGMYIGGTDERALHHLVAEALDNAMDEAVAGHANRIELELSAEGWVTVRDNGRGIPVDPHPRFPDKSALEVILTMLHSGGKFGGNAYKTSGGLHGVGISVVNALGDSLEVEVARDRRLYRQRYSRGAPEGPVEDRGPVQDRRGTALGFHPGPGI